jgi:hypothetical protein
MAYKFNFDLTRLPRTFFEELAKVADNKKIHKKAARLTRNLAKKFKVAEITGIPVNDGLIIIEDLLDVYIHNIVAKNEFKKTKKRALFLPHCSRKYMDNRCKAKFDPALSSYFCAHCSRDCPVNKATTYAKKKNYDVYVVPGGSCIKKILSKKRYEGVVGVACCEEAKLGLDLLSAYKIKGIAIPLIKNGCANTKFDMNMLKRSL